MPKLNGLEATRLIMETNPTPIVIVSGSESTQEVATTFDAMDAGALAVLRRPAGIGHADHQATARDMVQTIKLMSEVKVVRRWSRMRNAGAHSAARLTWVWSVNRHESELSPWEPRPAARLRSKLSWRRFQRIFLYRS